MTTLDRLRPGDRGTIDSLEGEPRLLQRLFEFGLLDGEALEVVAIAPLGDPIEIRFRQTRLSLRRAEAACVRLRPAP